MTFIDDVYSRLFKDKLSTTIVTMLLVFYSGFAKPKLPKPIKELFKYSLFRILVLSLIVYKGNQNTQLSLMIAVAFTLTLNYLNEEEMKKIESAAVPAV